jgi:hypothetical protein
MRYLDYIINLVAMAFLFGNDYASIEAESHNFSNIIYLDTELEFWRKKDSKGKLYNLIYFIRKTLQRRERFFKYYKITNTKEINIKNIFKTAEK